MIVPFDTTSFSSFSFSLGQSGISHRKKTPHSFTSFLLLLSRGEVSSFTPPVKGPGVWCSEILVFLLTCLLSFTHTMFYKFLSALHTAHCECTSPPPYLSFWRPLWYCLDVGFHACKICLPLFDTSIIQIFKASDQFLEFLAGDAFRVTHRFQLINTFCFSTCSPWHLRCLFPSASCFYVLGGRPHLPAFPALTSMGDNRIYGLKAEKRQREGGERKRKAKRLLAGGDGQFEKNSGRKRDCLTHGLTLLCFVRESALCCSRLSESPNSVNHCWRGTKAWEGWGAWLHCQREAGPSVCVHVCMCVCVSGPPLQERLLAGWLTLDLTAPLFSVYSSCLVAIMK